MARRMVGSEIIAPGGINNMRRRGQPLYLAAFYHDDGAMLFASFFTKRAAIEFRHTILDREFFGC